MSYEFVAPERGHIWRLELVCTPISESVSESEPGTKLDPVSSSWSSTS